jgi:NAD(P)-dependent dehydrogenase (short-subunit alcohol dehydrogenase family)
MMGTSQALAGRVALITGGGSGIGLGIAKAFALAGASVVLASRKLERLEESVRHIETLGGKALACKTDVRSYEEVAGAMDAAARAFGGLDIVVANAAGNFLAPAREMSINAWKTVIDIDLNGTFYCAKAAYPFLKSSPHGGRFLAISTMRALEGWPGCGHAGAAKAGIMSLVRTLSVEWGAERILCNTIAAGPIGDTEGVKRIYADAGKELAELATVPLGRFGTVADIASAALFLSSDAGSYITGSDLVVDGGRQRGGGRTIPFSQTREPESHDQTISAS